MESIWIKDYLDKKIPKVNKNIKTPVLIIGGGITGLMCAYNFMKNNINFILVDGRKIACGVSANTTAQVSIAHDKLYNEIAKKHGNDMAISYLNLQMEGLNLIKEIIETEKIKCDLKNESTILCACEEKSINTLNEQYNLISKYNKNCKLKIYDNDIFKYRRAIEFNNQFIFNPMKYMMSIIDILLKNKVPLYENSTVTKIEKLNSGYEVTINDKYKIHTNKIVMACHYPFLNPDNLYFVKIYQSKSYAVAFKTKIKLNANYVSLDKPYFYLRTYDDSTLIIGGSDHFTGINIDIEKCYNTLIEKIYELDKDAVILNKWFTEDCMVLDSLPFVGRYSNKKNDILLATGFQKWGFTNSHIAAKNITNIIMKENNSEIFKTNRNTIFKDLKSTGRMLGHVIDGLIISKIFVKKYNLDEIEIGSGKVTRFNNTNVLVYRESKNKFIFLKNSCTHMGCSLIWNDVDKVWESKCHGSIFDRYGHVIYGPAYKDLEELYF